jgi:hypothetical protein
MSRSSAQFRPVSATPRPFLLPFLHSAQQRMDQLDLFMEIK